VSKADPNQNFITTIRHMSPGYWGEAIRLQLTRIEACQEWIVSEVRRVQEWSPPEPEPKPDSFYQDGVAYFHRMSADCHFLLIAMRNLLRAIEAQPVGKDRRVIEAREEFEHSVPHAKDFRDILEHLDDYQAGKGRLQKPGPNINPEERGLFLWYHSRTDPSAEVDYHFGDLRVSVPLKVAATGAIELASVAEQVEEEVASS
jgi:hypothetical protein